MEQPLHLIELAITPPGVILVLLIVCFFAYMRSYWAGTMLLAATAVLFVILSLPLTAQMLTRGLQAYAKPIDLTTVKSSAPVTVKRGAKTAPEARPPAGAPQAIVVLGAGRYAEAPEYGFRDTVSPLGLVRLRYAAALQHRSGLPILVSGGAPGGEATAEAEHMRDVLVNEFHASVKWIEDRSRNTRENATYSAAHLAPAKIGHVYLVTHAWHMRRAARAFEQAGIQVTPAPTGFYTLSPKARELTAYLPSSEGMNQTRMALHERLGFMWHGMEDGAKPANGGTAAPVVPAPQPGR